MTTKFHAEMTLTEKRSLVEQALSGGHFAKIAWKKKDGSLAERVCKKFIERLFTSGDKNEVQANPVAHVTNMFTCVDSTNDKWININLDALVEIHSNKEVITFQ